METIFTFLFTLITLISIANTTQEIKIDIQNHTNNAAGAKLYYNPVADYLAQLCILQNISYRIFYKLNKH